MDSARGSGSDEERGTARQGVEGEEAGTSSDVLREEEEQKGGEERDARPLVSGFCAQVRSRSEFRS